MKIAEGGARHEYRAGEAVPTSGVYTAVHELHRQDHEVVAIQGEEFPRCRKCKDYVRFYLAYAVPHMTHDFDLTGPDRRIWGRHARKKGAAGAC